MSTLRRRVALAALLLLVPTLAACGFGDQTDQVYQAAVGVNDRTGQVWVLNGLIVSDTDGSGTFAGSLTNQDSKSAKLVSVTGAQGTVAISIPGNSLVNLGTTGLLRLKDPAITPGAFVPLTFEFSNGQISKVSVPVVNHSGDYSNVSVGPLPSASPTSTPATSTKKKQPSAGTTATSSATSTATATAVPSN